MILIDRLSGKKTPSVPFWFMRQAGRYLPEYKKIRQNFPDFLTFCYTPEAACEVTIQPINRFDMSAAIIFSDILVIPDALGMNVRFEEGIGPVLESISDPDALKKLNMNHFQEKLQPVYQAIRLTRKNLADDKALMGFCGAPWTLACYMLEGKSSRDFAKARSVAFGQKDFFRNLISILTDSVIQHSKAQIEAGVNAIQIFDSWAGVLSEYEFHHYVVLPTRKIVQEIKKSYPHIPVIGFPRMCGEKIGDYSNITTVDAVSADGSVSLTYLKKHLACTVQGNLDNILLAEDKEEALRQTRKILEMMREKSFVFNLSHGILPHTPLENVQAVSDMIHNFT